jgi:hypothetical protein
MNINPCKEVKFTTHVLDIEFNGERIKFEGLDAKQSACVLKMYECYITSVTRKSSVLEIKKSKS